MTDSEDDYIDTDTSRSSSPGAQLRAARERKGLTLEQVASETRISRRHLESLEAGNYDAMPGRTYVVGFTRTYAKTVGLNEEDMIEAVRAELDSAAVDERYEQQARGKFEPGDPSRAPGGRLLYFSLFAVVILLIGIFFAARALFAPAAEIPSLVEQQAQEEAEAAAARQAAQPQEQQAAAEEPTGAVVFTAEGETWVRFYDGEGNVLQEGTMREGDSFTLPADATNPQIITGRPDRLAITIGGRPVRKLSTEPETLQDVAISAEALLAREGGVATIGFGLGTAAEPAPEPAVSSAAPVSRPAPQPAAPAPSPTPSATRAASPAPTPTPSPTPSVTVPAATASPEPSTAATAPPRAEPADPVEDGVAPEPN